MSEVVLKSVKRVDTGKKAVKATRKKGLVPGVYYIKGSEPISIAATPLDLRSIVYTKDAKIVKLSVEGSSTTYDCVLQDVSFDPITDKIVHFDLHGFDPNSRIETEVPVRLVGSALGVREGGVLEHVVHKLHVSCLPMHLPEHIDIDVAPMKIGSSVHVSDIKVANVKIHANADVTIVSVKAARTASADAAASSEPELVAQKGKKED